ncbi:LytR/AlgR family response regulator transcription factor [Flavivirga algicola]|uniref:Response regulator transcription factor n=1 Tax=Flavivirga algicola TaxID=2729136 RepID=A0ABX1RW85_9FLAO|nr:LytTR family DNA-binding domain-containing protein [Flavivirga algicola]NMH87260.1 response regulator transcription factor [Flavivirga algicola]
MTVLKCLIVDDEPIAREALKGYCYDIVSLEVIGVCKNARQAQVFLQENHVDLLFLDIQMPIITGIEWLKKQKDTPPVIMTTAYSEHALESYNFNVIDYLVKPISFERFKQAVGKARDLMYNKAPESYLFVKQDKEIKKVKLNTILFVEAQQNYVKIVTTAETLITHSTLKGIKLSLPEEDFIKTHKSFLVALHKIDKISENKVFVKEHILPLSTRLKKEVTTKVKSNNYLK